ncbi:MULTISPECIES: hypothetical protein [Streptomyces]|uniref:hypothetical protein n=1 Tax=Streptomyces TaxID=1883 RepID=UPI0012FEB914|nr:hypothetical protein [Streptomyces durhamensis]
MPLATTTDLTRQADTGGHDLGTVTGLRTGHGCLDPPGVLALALPFPALFRPVAHPPPHHPGEHHEGH